MRLPTYCFFLFVLLAGCRVTDQPDNLIVHNSRYPENNNALVAGLTVTKVAEFGLESDNEESIIGGFSGVAFGNDDNVYILDRNPLRLKAYGPTGKPLWAKLSEGKAPGYLFGTRKIVIDGNRYIYIHNQGGVRTDRFSMDGKYISSISMQDLGLNQPTLHGLLNDSTFVYSKPLRGTYGAKTGHYGVTSTWNQ